MHGALGFNNNYTLYPSRRGGASWEFGNIGRMDEVLPKGRWGSVKSARVHIRDLIAAVRFCFARTLVCSWCNEVVVCGCVGAGVSAQRTHARYLVFVQDYLFCTCSFLMFASVWSFVYGFMRSLCASTCFLLSLSCTLCGKAARCVALLTFMSIILRTPIWFSLGMRC